MMDVAREAVLFVLLGKCGAESGPSPWAPWAPMGIVSKRLALCWLSRRKQPRIWSRCVFLSGCGCGAFGGVS